MGDGRDGSHKTADEFKDGHGERDAVRREVGSLARYEVSCGKGINIDTTEYSDECGELPDLDSVQSTQTRMETCIARSICCACCDIVDIIESSRVPSIFNTAIIARSQSGI